MKERIRHGFVVAIITVAILGGAATFLNNVSYNPDFTVIDAISGASKKVQNGEDESGKVTWKYTRADVVLPENQDYKDEKIEINQEEYQILRNISYEDKSKKLVILSNEQNISYQKSVREVASYLKKQGYDIRIKQCTETMMLSLVHTGNFDIFLMSKEAR